MLTKSAAQRLQKNFQDYIPGGNRLSRDQVVALQFRATAELEIYHCGMQTGNDIQSGPYCGDLADFVAPGPDGGIVAVCGRHKQKLLP